MRCFEDSVAIAEACAARCERAQLEHHPGVWPARNDVLFGLLGTELLAAPAPPPEETGEDLLVDGLAGSSGSTIGPDGALYFTEGAVGRVTRVDPVTGETSTFASGLPQLSEAAALAVRHELD